jgi:transcriptional regulator with XRE-family HTH domain
MNQIELIVAAKQQQGLTSDNQVALRLGVTRSRVSQIARNLKPADEAEIAMLADMAGIDLHIALAAVHKDREKNPAKRAYWEKIAVQFSMAIMLVTVCLLTVFPKPAEAKTQVDNLQIMRSYRTDPRR